MLAALMASLLATGASSPPVPPATVDALAHIPQGARIGLLVVDDTGREIVSVRPDERFVPASNAKLYTSAAAFATLDTSSPDATGGATVRLERRGGVSDVVLAGHGDARLSSAAGCVTDCLRDLARAVARRTRIVGNVIGDDSAFPDERWPLGMSWNNMVAGYGTAISALSVDDNEETLTIRAGTLGAPPVVTGDGYYRIDNRMVTFPAAATSTIAVARLPGSDVLRVTGTIPLAAAPRTIRVGVDDPARRAAWRLAALLRDEGVRVTGKIDVRHRVPGPADDPAVRGVAPAPSPPTVAVLARLTPPPLADDILRTNKTSQNLHAELLLRRIAAARGSGSVADGRAVVGLVLDHAGVPRGDYDLSDGAGMSTYDRVTPRSTVTLLRWAAMQPWAAAWRAMLPVAGVDGTLAKRFRGTPLASRLFAKTGSLNATDALSGYFLGASGRLLTFAAYVSDLPDGTDAKAEIDAMLVMVAMAN